jgi:hypothetical protein
VPHDLAPEMRTLTNARLDALKLFQQSIQWWDDTGRNARFVHFAYEAVMGVLSRFGGVDGDRVFGDFC